LKDVCEEICGDGRVVGKEKCDDEILEGCTEDCLEVADGWKCEGGDEESKS